MNPVDHPLGGGEGKTSGGRHPVTPWGVPTKGYKTRRPQPSDKFIVAAAKQISHEPLTEKGPFVDTHLLEKVEAMNRANERRSSRPGRAARP